MNSLRLFPSRNQFKNIAREAMEEVLSYYEKSNLEFGSQAEFKQKYCHLFSQYMCSQQKGYADVVCSGTAAIYIAILALDLEVGSEILVSSITDPGMISPVIIAGFSPKLVDNEYGMAHPSLQQIQQRTSNKVKAIIINHLSGKAVPEIEAICIWANLHGIKVIEDVSQAHGAHINHKKLGTFGDIACFSTMYSKNHSTGGRGGVIYTKNLNLYNRVRMYADKGKPFHVDDFNPKNPSQFHFPALNFNIDEVSCAIGIKTLSKLDETINRRLDILKNLKKEMQDAGLTTKLLTICDGDSPFFGIFHFEDHLFKVNKNIFTNLLIEEGLTINPHYPYIASEWPWLTKYLSDGFSPKNAITFRNSTFNFLFNENYSIENIHSIVEIFKKVESKFLLI